MLLVMVVIHHLPCAIARCRHPLPSAHGSSNANPDTSSLLVPILLVRRRVRTLGWRGICSRRAIVPAIASPATIECIILRCVVKQPRILDVHWTRRDLLALLLGITGSNMYPSRTLRDRLVPRLVPSFLCNRTGEEDLDGRTIVSTSQLEKSNKRKNHSRDCNHNPNPRPRQEKRHIPTV